MGQGRDEVNILNLRYKDSIEDKVHKILAERLKDIYDIFGQIPDILVSPEKCDKYMVLLELTKEICYSNPTENGRKMPKIWRIRCVPRSKI